MSPVEPSVAVLEPAVTVVEINDPAAANEGMELLDHTVVKLQLIPLRARRVIVRIEDATVVFHSSNLRLLTQTSVRDGLLAFVTFGPQARGMVNGLAVRPGLMLAAEAGTAASFVVEAGWESIAFLVPPSEIRAHWTARHRQSEFRIPNGVEMLQVSEERVHSLFGWGRGLVDTAVDKPALFDWPASGRLAARVELFETLLATLRTASDFEPTRGDRTRRRHSLIVKTAENYALSRTGVDIYVTDLCKVAEVSERTLENAFKVVMGLTPVAYLIRLRLHRVRRALLAAARGSTTVSAEALGWGFWHFGDFTRAYKECFGELPSDSLRRNPESPG